MGEGKAFKKKKKKELGKMGLGGSLGNFQRWKEEKEFSEKGKGRNFLTKAQRCADSW